MSELSEHEFKLQVRMPWGIERRHSPTKLYDLVELAMTQQHPIFDPVLHRIKEWRHLFDEACTNKSVFEVSYRIDPGVSDTPAQPEGDLEYPVVGSSPAQPTCGDCTFSSRNGTTNGCGNTEYLCRRFPGIRHGGSGIDAARAKWPIVYSSEWCGEWKQREAS